MQGYRVRYDTGNVVFRLAYRGDDDKILQFFPDVFSRRFSRDLHEWFSYRCPRGPIRYYLALDARTDQLIGLYGLLPLKIKLGDALEQGSLCVNGGVRDWWQRGGLFQDLGKYALNRDAREMGSKVALSLPNKLAVKGQIRTGWKHVRDLAFMARFAIPAATTSAQEVDSFPPEVNALLGEVAARYEFAMVKDARWLNWRYERPDQRYSRRVVYDGDSIVGYAVFKRFVEPETGYIKAHIVDIESIDEEVFRQLVFAAYEFAQGVDELNTWVFEGTERQRFLERLGFKPSSARNPLLLFFHNEAVAERLSMERDWSMMLGDNDVY